MPRPGGVEGFRSEGACARTKEGWQAVVRSGSRLKSRWGRRTYFPTSARTTDERVDRAREGRLHSPWSLAPSIACSAALGPTTLVSEDASHRGDRIQNFGRPQRAPHAGPEIGRAAGGGRGE